MSVLPYEPSQFTMEGQAYTALLEHSNKLQAEVNRLQALVARPAHPRPVRVSFDNDGDGHYDLSDRYADDGEYYHVEDVAPLLVELERLRAAINTPHTADFLEAVKLEAIHQRERWGSAHDAGKTDADWFWLAGFLLGKALGDTRPGKDLHHIITTAAALLNWHAHKTGADTSMRPGIEPPPSQGRG